MSRNTVTRVDTEKTVGPARSVMSPGQQIGPSALRKPMLYPLSYEGGTGAKRGRKPPTTRAGQGR
jgi:hypothetical protein